MAEVLHKYIFFLILFWILLSLGIQKIQQFYHRFFQKEIITSNIGMLGVYPEAIDCNIVLLTQISFCVSVSEEKALSESKNLQNGPIYLSVFGIQLLIWLPKMKYECAAQYFSLLPLDKHPTCLCLKFLILLKKMMIKLS